MSSSNPFGDWDPKLVAALRVAVGREPIPVSSTCNHAPVTCVWKSEQDHSCKIEPLCEAWLKADHTYTHADHPLVVALAKAGCDPYRARMVISEEGYGMDIASSAALISAYRKLGYGIRHPIPVGVRVCDQCRPGSNTFALRGSSYEGHCYFIPVSVAANMSVMQEGKVLCIGAGGELRWCGKGEFMAVSHVWEHGWQGDSERGLCTRVLDLLLFVAGLFGLEWVWIDIAMISREPQTRSLAINAMNFVYSSSKVTVVFDRLLMSMDGGSDRERVMAMFLADWMTRVWTMQEALLSQDLVFLFADAKIHGYELQNSMTNNTARPGLHWQQWASIRSLCIMLDGVATPMLDRVRILSKERLTSKREDMSRAIFPLFKLEWPGRSTSLEEGQVKILQHLAKRAARLAPLHGPIMPSPWSWAPLVIPGTSGFLQPQGEERPLHPDGLRGRWAAWRILKLISREEIDGRLRTNSHSVRVANLTGTCYDMVSFEIEGAKLPFGAGVFSRKENTYPWKGQKLFLLRAVNTGTSRTKELDYYDLVVIDRNPHSSGMPLFHRIGSVYGGLKDGTGGQGLDVGDLYLDGFMN